jgi:DNA-binding helix-hairpin-helix protein with protein kinase domain
MSKPDLYSGGRRLDLGRQIGKGGEGEIYLLGHDSKLAVKVYTARTDGGREEKVRAMVGLGLAEAHQLVSFPKDVVTAKSGAFAGFTMRLVENCRQVHELYGVKSRKIHYPKADFRFLVRAAANTARAVADVHRSNCVIGDVNHSGVLVANDARVALIDADSFQLAARGRTYPCLVGVPDFTPPELQGRPLAGIVRTPAHDQFGLAVAIFQLLFMGRHPYAGQSKDSHLTLDQFIARNLFAYSRARNTGVTPPVGVATLEDFPGDIGAAFERAFGLDPARRPAPSEWSDQLKSLEGSLNRCSINAMHFYPSAAKGCPWCRMEGRSGAVLFLYGMAATVVRPVSNFDLEKAWAAIKAIAIPDVQSMRPKLPVFPTSPSAEARGQKQDTWQYKAGALAVFGVAAALFITVPQAFFFWFFIVAFGFSVWNKKPSYSVDWQGRYREIDTRWQQAEHNWRERTGANSLITLRANLEQSVEEFRGLNAAKAAAHVRLTTERRKRQLNDFLDRFLIARVAIPGIGPAKTATLASFGIESAADIDRNAILAISGFGSATADKLMDWRAMHEKRFQYNPAPLPADAQAAAKVETEFSAKASELAKRISGGQGELEQLANAVRQRLSSEDSFVSEVATRRAQLEVDLRFLGLLMPSPAPAVYTPPKPSPPAPGSRPAGQGAGTTGSGQSCPQCGAPMVKRMARRGRRSGSMFWGCTRYPLCRGTRN